MKRASLITLSLIGAYSVIQGAWAADYPLPPAGSRLIGQNQTYVVQPQDRNLQAISRHFDTSAMLLVEANDTMAPIPAPGTTLTIPTQMLPGCGSRPTSNCRTNAACWPPGLFTAYCGSATRKR